MAKTGVPHSTRLRSSCLSLLVFYVVVVVATTYCRRQRRPAVGRSLTRQGCFSRYCFATMLLAAAYCCPALVCSAALGHAVPRGCRRPPDGGTRRHQYPAGRRLLADRRIHRLATASELASPFAIAARRRRRLRPIADLSHLPSLCCFVFIAVCIGMDVLTSFGSDRIYMEMITTLKELFPGNIAYHIMSYTGPHPRAARIQAHNRFLEMNIFSERSYWSESSMDT